MTIRDKVEGLRVIPLTPYLAHLLALLPRRNEFVFSSPTAAGGCLVDPHDAFKKACAVADVDLTLYGLRRSFATLSEWIETPAGIAAQIQGHKPSGVREKHYIRRPLDLLRCGTSRLNLGYCKKQELILCQHKLDYKLLNKNNSQRNNNIVLLYVDMC